MYRVITNMDCLVWYRYWFVVCGSDACTWGLDPMYCTRICAQKATVASSTTDAVFALVEKHVGCVCIKFSQAWFVFLELLLAYTSMPVREVEHYGSQPVLNTLYE